MLSLVHLTIVPVKSSEVKSPGIVAKGPQSGQEVLTQTKSRASAQHYNAAGLLLCPHEKETIEQAPALAHPEDAG